MRFDKSGYHLTGKKKKGVGERGVLSAMHFDQYIANLY